MTRSLRVTRLIVLWTIAVLLVFITPVNPTNRSLLGHEGESESSFPASLSTPNDTTTTSIPEVSSLALVTKIAHPTKVGNSSAENLSGSTGYLNTVGISHRDTTQEQTTHRDKHGTPLGTQKTADNRQNSSLQIRISDQQQHGTQPEYSTLSSQITDGLYPVTGDSKSKESRPNGSFEWHVVGSTTDTQSPRALNLTALRLMACSYQKASQIESEDDESFFPNFWDLETDWCEQTPQILKQVTADVCGTRYLCSSYPTPPGKDCNAECVPCQCDQSCHEYGDCCVDIRDPLMPEPVVENTTCVEPGWTVFGTETRARMVTTCPMNIPKDSELSRQCEYPNISIQHEATPVSDRYSGITYQNAFCALCNSVESFVAWTHRVICEFVSELDGLTTDEELWAKVVSSDYCRIVTSPPNEIQVEHRCYLPSIGQCNATGDWAGGPNVVLMERLCESYEQPVKYKPLRYRNIFCAICNGIDIELTYALFCPGTTDPLPFPLTVLLDFGPRDQPERLPAYREVQQHCGNGTVLDPFSKDCVSLKCQQNQMLRDGVCHHLFSSANGLGFSIPLLLRRTSGLTRLPDDEIGTDIFTQLKEVIDTNFEGVLVHKLQLRFLRNNVLNVTDFDKILVSLKIIVMSKISFEELDILFDTIDSVNFTLWASRGNETVFSTTLLHCPVSEDKLLDNVIDVDTSSHLILKQFDMCLFISDGCVSNIRYISPDTLPQCRFAEFNLSSQNFSYDSDSGYISYKDKEFVLNQSRLFHCGDILRVCSDLLEGMSNFFASASSAGGVRVKPSPPDLVLSLVSLVCLSCSLLGLLLTILVYSCLSKLRNLPGKITMFLVGHLFVAILLFLVGSNWQDDTILCQVFGVGIHYFWMTVFGWTMAAAYHMFRVFASLRAVTVGDGGERSRTLVRYFLICHFLSALVVGGCIAYNYLRSHHQDIGYGQTVCFISEPQSVGVFFAAPLMIMLVFNMFCFVRTIFAIRDVPDMSNVSNSENRRYVFVYIKIAVLFGFTWVFGLIGPLVESVVIRYGFVVLTGCQGIFIFIGYCLTGRAWVMLKQKIIPRSSLNAVGKPSLKSVSSNRNYEKSTAETD